MTTTVVVLLCVYLSFYLHVFLHEREHAKAAMNHGFRPHMLAVGAPIPFLWGLYWEIRHPKLLDGVPVRIYPLLIGGAFKFDLTQLRCLLQCRFGLQAEILSAGVWANFFYTSLALAAFEAWLGRWPYMAGALGCALALWAGKKLFVVYLCPVISVLLGAYMLPRLVMDIIAMHPKASATISHGIAQSFSFGLVPIQGVQIFLLAGFLVGLMNLLPILPFDGGRLIHAFLGLRSRPVAKVYAYATLPFCLVLLVYSLFLEAYAIFAR